MKSLITDEQRTQLPANGRRSRSEPIGLDGGRYGHPRELASDPDGANRTTS